MDIEDGREFVGLAGAVMYSKDIIVFGTGQYFENYMVCNGIMRRPLFAVDNDEAKWGTTKYGIQIKSAHALEELQKDSFYVTICCANWKPIARQLEELGVVDYQYYRPLTIENSMEDVLRAREQKYQVGYVPGAFDLFHAGHLNLLRNSKDRCEYLIAGVLTDELVEHFKGRRPVIPYEQRAAVVGAIEYVDRVVPVDFSNTYKIDAWKKYHYDCHFSGNDHGADWDNDLKQLRAVGSNMEFLTYSSANSSTRIKQKL